MNEDPEGLASIAIFKAMHGPGDVSGAQIADFSRGWAIPAFRWGPVHYLIIVGDYVATSCGLRFPIPYVKGQGVAFFGQGNFRWCKRCEKIERNK